MKTICIITIAIFCLPPTAQPSCIGTLQPSNHPTVQPSNHQPSTLDHQPSKTIEPASHPTIEPSSHPTIKPSSPPDSLPPSKTLYQAIDAFYAHQTHLDLLKFKESKKGEWLKFLPNLGITYTVTGQPRPSISLSSGILYQAQRDKQTRAAKRQQIIEKNQLAAEREKAKLQGLLLRHRLLLEELDHLESLHRVEAQIFAIREDEYQRQERAPSDFLQAKRTFLLQKKALRDKAGQLQLLELEILAIAHLK